MKKATKKISQSSGNLRIGDNWNAITIIALSQNNPLKAIAEFVENSIDANAERISIIRGKDHGEQYLKIVDDGKGIPQNAQGIPDFKYVATHICDSLKKRLKRDGASGIQGEFGIGLLSFWTVGDRLIMSSADSENRIYRMEMKRNEPGYAITKSRALFSHAGVEMTIQPLLPGIRKLSGEKIQAYLASELRDRIKTSGVHIEIIDRQARKKLEVHPRKYQGTLLHQFNTINSLFGDVQFELYLGTAARENTIELFRQGTRVIADISTLSGFDESNVWSSGYLSGMIDAGFLQLTPGTRDGVIRDERFDSFFRAVMQIEPELTAVIDQAKLASEEQASKSILKSVRRALKEAFMSLPPEDYAWLDITVAGRSDASSGNSIQRNVLADASSAGEEFVAESIRDGKKKFYEHAGPLYSTAVSPGSAIVRVGTTRTFRAIARDKNRRAIDSGVQFTWKVDGGSIDTSIGEFTEFTAPSEPGLLTLTLNASQEILDDTLTAEASGIITVTEELLPKADGPTGTDSAKGFPGYTYARAPGELWRSQYDAVKNLVTINNGHKDFLFASHKKTRKLRYILQLYAKELVLNNFPGYDGNELLERMVELSLYAEDSLR